MPRRSTSARQEWGEKDRAKVLLENINCKTIFLYLSISHNLPATSTIKIAHGSSWLSNRQ